MRQLPGARLDWFPYDGARHERDLLAYDGPLVSLFRTPAGEPILYVWVDVDESANRWLVLRVSERNLIRYTEGRRSLRDLVMNPAERSLCVVDRDRSFSISAQSIARPQNLPQEYVPAEDSFLETDEASAQNSYAMLIDGEWESDKMQELLSKFRALALLEYHFRDDGRTERLKGGSNLPWKMGGFSAQHYFDRLLMSTPKPDKPKMQAFVYASPGYVRWSVPRDIALAIRAAVDGLDRDEETAARVAREASAFIKGHGLNDDDAKPSDEQNIILDTLFETLGRAIWPSCYTRIRDAHRMPFVCLKILMAYQRRVKFLRDLLEKRQIEL